MSEPRIHTIDRVGERTTNGAPRWTVHHVDQDGNGGGHVFPKDTLEWRAAEYGISDVAELLDIVLHEPYLPDVPDRDDAAARVGLVTSAGPEAEPITLFNAPSTADAVAAHRLRIADVKRRHTRVVPPANGKDPLAVIKADHGIDTSRLRAKREAVDEHRWQLLYGGLPLPVPTITLEVPRA